ncbi:MAG: hypothetical protein Q4D62_07125 [Planctomycetia bacterium]|nr:hypothetical protein [Planctomycetia bacterium]
MRRKEFFQQIGRFFLLGGLSAGVFHLSRGRKNVSEDWAGCTAANGICRDCSLWEGCPRRKILEKEEAKQ